MHPPFPAHPSLPPPPSFPSQSTLLLHTPAYSSHYAQAYLQSYSTPPTTPSNFHDSTVSYFQNGRPIQPSSPWFQPGNNRCSYKRCSFVGSQKALEIHMMDRHLIYPPGWDKRRKKLDWDADPSLKGKPIPVQGTNIVLDSPEVLEAWIAERKKRFPTAIRVEDKKRKLQEAVARGQLSVEDMRFPFVKRRKTENSTTRNHDVRHGPGRGRGTSRGIGRGVDSGWGTRGGRSAPSHGTHPCSLPQLVNPNPPSSLSNDEPDMVTFREIVGSTKPSNTELVAVPASAVAASLPPESHLHPDAPTPSQARRHIGLQPKRPPRNPFASRPTLLRNLLLPEIRVTVSNLSQTIRFLVDNDFLRGVEITPGEADESKIQVLN